MSFINFFFVYLFKDTNISLQLTKEYSNEPTTASLLAVSGKLLVQPTEEPLMILDGEFYILIFTKLKQMYYVSDVNIDFQCCLKSLPCKLYCFSGSFIGRGKGMRDEETLFKYGVTLNELQIWQVSGSAFEELPKNRYGVFYSSEGIFPLYCCCFIFFSLFHFEVPQFSLYQYLHLQ